MKEKPSFGQKPMNLRPAQNEIAIETVMHTNMTPQIMMLAISPPEGPPQWAPSSLSSFGMSWYFPKPARPQCITEVVVS